MSLKDYFNKAASLQALSNKSAEEIASEIESVGYHEQDIIREERFIPRVDYSLPGNFARYGSAAEYYSQALKRIYEDYPYDGSLKEKIEWENDSTYLDLHIFEKDYPRTNGYINFSADGYGSSTLTDGYGLPATPEYIYLKGGPHPNSDTGASYAIQFTGSNVYETNKNRESNLKFDLQDNGASVEFWLKKDAFDLTKTEKEVIFDLWNGETSGSTSYGRFRLELTGASGADCFRATVFSGTVGFEMQSIADSNITSETVTDGNWHHYALTLKSGSSGINSDFYVDGTLNNTVTLGTVGINEVTGTLRAYVGALISSPTSSAAIAATAGKLSGSLDEFRYWKSQRTARDIGRFWFTQIGGGTNDDPTPFITTTETVNTDLGVYYKFNEGITGVTATDSVVLDFSGRVSNGAWTGYTSNSRNVGSAIVDSGAAIKEFKDPIIYSFHPEVEALSNNLQLTGSNYDVNNNASMYHLLPSWITEEDAEGHEQLRYLTQIMSSYFDTLHLQIESLSQLKNITYNTGSNKPLPFAEKLLSSAGLVSPNLFIDADVLEKLADRSEDRVYEKPLEEIKNTIYQNIYNNLVYIYKTKGTEKSFRNLIRCFGIDDELIKLNMYASNVEYEKRENRRNVAIADRFVNFNTGDNVNATVYQLQDPTDTTNTTGYFAANTRLTGGYAQTFEVDVDFPTKTAVNASYYADTNTISASLFGVHGVNETESDTTWDATDAPNFQVYAVRDELESDNVRFVLTGTAGGFVPSLESDLYEDTYQDTHWNLAVRIKPDKYPLSYQVAGTDTGVYTVELHGVQVDAGVVRNEFTLSGDARSGAATPAGFVTGSKRVYIGAHRTNFTGALLQPTDVKINSARYWFDYLEDETLRGHAHDTTNYGSLKPHFYAYPFNPRATGSAEVLKTDTLALNWEFSQNTGSNASGEFTVIDMSSGSAVTAASRFGWLGPFLSKQYSGGGYEFAASSTSAVDKDFQVSSKLQLPENVQSSDMVTVLNAEEQNVRSRDSRPVDYFFAFEKSMAQAVSSEMINYFATLKDINTLIGAPVNRYRPEYKGLKLLRQRFFDKVSNSEIDFEKFYEFYKWFDSSLTVMLQQLIPASADFAENVRTVIESHMLERSKYQHKFQNVKKQGADPEGTAQGNWDTSADGNSPEDDPTGTGLYSANVTTKRQVGTSQPLNVTRWGRTHAPIGITIESPGTAKSMLFDGDNPSEIDIGADSVWEPLVGGAGAAAKAFSFSAWIKSDGTTGIGASYGVILDLAAWDRVLLIDYSSRPYSTYNLKYYMRGSTPGEAATATGGLNKDVWYHVAVTYTGGTAGTIALYVDGASAATSITAPSNPDAIASGHGCNIGVDYNGGVASFGGNMCDAAVWDKALSAAEVSEIYGSGTRANLNTTTCKDNLLSWWKMGSDPLDTYNGTIYDQVGGRNGTASNFNSAASIEEDSPAFAYPYGTTIGTPLQENSLWWQNRAERWETALSSSWAPVNSDKQAMLNTKKLSDARAQQAPYKFTMDGNSTLGGIGFNINKKIDFVYNATQPFSALAPGTNKPVNMMLASGSGVEQLMDTTDDYHPAYHQRLGFEVDPDIHRNNDNKNRNDGNLLAPFSVYSSSIDTGYNKQVIDNYAPSISITNMHADLVYDSDMSLQSPFADQHVGGREHRHIALNTGDDDATNRPEAWKIEFDGFSSSAGGAMAIVPPNYAAAETLGYDKDIPVAHRLRNVGIKRPVNIRNIQTVTGTVAIGNYEKNYQVVQSAGRTANDPFFNDQSFDFALNPETIATRGKFPLDATSTANISGNLDYTLPNRTGTNSNQTIIVNRFSSPGGYTVQSRGYMDPAHEELSVYNALPYRNLSVLDYGLSGSASVDPTLSNTIRVQDQIDKVRGLDQRATLHAGPFGSDAAYGSVPELTYVTTPSYHKTNRNAKKRIESAPAGYITGTVYDNLYVQHQIPRSTQQYAWVTASLAEDKTIYGLQAPTCVSASSLDMLITGSDSRLFVGADNLATDRIHGDFVGLRSLVTDPISPELADLPTPLKVVNTKAMYSRAGGGSSYLSYRFTGSAELNTNQAETIMWWVNPYNWSWYLLRGDHTMYYSSMSDFVSISVAGGLWHAYNVVASGKLKSNSWNHITLVNDWSVSGSATSQLYINGEPQEMTIISSATPGLGNWSPGSVIEFSRANHSGGLTGYISDIQWYNVAMGDMMVDAIYGHSPLNVKKYAPKSLITNTQPNLIGWWTCGDDQRDIPSTIYNQIDVSGGLDNLGVISSYSTTLYTPTISNIADLSYAADGKTDCIVTKYSFSDSSDLVLGYPHHKELSELSFPLGGGLGSYGRLTSADNYNYSDNYVEAISTFNTLMLNRNGPYGYPSWKQIRVGEGPVARKLRSENKIGQVNPPQMLTGTYGLEQALYPTEVTEYIEAPIADSAQPVVFAFEDNTDFPDASNNMLVKASFQNNLDYFTNTGLNSRLNLKVNPEDGNVYNTLTDFTLQSNLSTVVKYGQKIYPAAENTFRTRTRTRENYDISNIWNDARTFRSVPDGVLPVGFGAVNSQGDQDPSASMWPLDSFIYNSGLPGSGSGAGELMNSYSRFGVPGAQQVTASATYVMPLQYGESDVKFVGASTPVSSYILTAPPYTAAEQAGISPYQPYLDYAQNIRVIGKDMSIIPEFRISEHIAEYELNKGSNFLAKLDNIFNLTGASIPDSSQSEFYNVYSTADFMKYFKVVDDDLADKANGSGTRLARHSIELACDALLQFLPYKGFYPAERTQELSALLSQSLGEVTVYNSYYQEESIMRRIIYEPLISPGILFNTIKSGIACSNFVVVNTDPYTGTAGSLSNVAGYPTYDLDTATTTKYIGNWNNGGAGGIFGLTEATLGPLNTQYVDPGDPAFIVFKGATGDGPAGAPYNNGWNPCLNIAGSASADTHHNGYYMHKIPFEALRDPDRHLGFSAIPGSRFFDTGVGSASLDTAMDGYAAMSTTYYEGKKCWLRYSGKSNSNMYKLGIDNFLCETYNFFLGSTEKTTFLSKEEDNFLAVEKDKYYGLQVRLAQSTAPVSSYYTGLGIPTTFGMYSRASAFGAPLVLSGTNRQGAGANQFLPFTGHSTTANMWASYEHVLPPSYYGEALANIIVKSTYSGKASIDELLASAVIEYNKKSLYNGNDPRIVETLDLPDRSVIQAQIDSSVDLFEKHLVVPEGTTTQKARWMIRPKFETPVLNFYNVDVGYDLPAAAPYIATGSYGQQGTDGMAIRGMWHQYGNKVSGSEGLYLSVAELPTKMSSSTYGNIAVESLSKIVGFDTNQKRIGDFAESKKVEEAIVCIPFLTSLGDRKYFNVEKDSQEYLTQLALLNKYIFPPTFDFLTNQDVSPIAFYAFEFDLVLSQDDLVNIWQNLPPSSSTKFEKKTSTIKIRNLVDRLLDNDEDLQWMVFKVKRRAEKDYNILTRKNLGGGTPIVQPSINSPYSYNWPYDYFSFVELIKIGADVVYATEDLFDEEVEETPVKEKLREFIPATKDMSLSIAPRAAVIDVPFEGTTKPSSAAASKRATKSSVSTKTATSKRKGSSRKKR